MLRYNNNLFQEYESDNSDILQYANIKILQDNICEKSYGMDNFKREHMICAGFPIVNILKPFLKIIYKKNVKK